MYGLSYRRIGRRDSRSRRSSDHLIRSYQRNGPEGQAVAHGSFCFNSRCESPGMEAQAWKPRRNSSAAEAQARKRGRFLLECVLPDRERNTYLRTLDSSWIEET